MSVTYYKGFVGKEDIEFGTGTFTRKDKNHVSRDLTQINASHIPFNSQVKYIDDLVDEGYDVDIFPRISIPKNTLSTMTGHETFSSTDGQVFWKDPGGASRNFNPSGTFDAAHIIYLINTADASENITFDSAGLAQVVGQGQSGIFIYNGTDWDLINKYTSPETNIEIAPGITSDHGFSGIYSSETIGENVVFGNTLYLKSDGKLWKSDSDIITTMPVIAISLASISADDSGNILKFGYIRDDSWTWTVGGLIYASGTAGALTQTKPISGIYQIIGYAFSADVMFFNPQEAIVLQSFITNFQRSQFTYNGGSTAYTIKAKSASYYCKDKYCHWISELTTNAIGTPSADDWYFLYLDYSAITDGVAITANELIWSSTPPTFNSTLMGWYNVDDRCIFAVRTNSGPTNILEFFNNGSNYILYADQITDRSTTDLDTTWTDVTLTIPDICIMANVTLRSLYGANQASASTGNLFWRTNGQDGSVGHMIANSYIISTGIYAYASMSEATVITDSNRVIEIKHDIDDTNLAGVFTDGFYLPIGM